MKRALVIAALLLILAPLLGGLLLLEPTPLVPPNAGATPKAADVRALHTLARDLLGAFRQPGVATTLEIDEPTMRTALSILARSVPGLAADGAITADRVEIALSQAAPWPGGRRFFNVAARFSADDARPFQPYLRLAGLELDGAAALWLMRLPLSLRLGGDEARGLVDAVGDLTLTSGRAVVLLQPNHDIGAALKGGDFSIPFIADPDMVMRYLDALAQTPRCLDPSDICSFVMLVNTAFGAAMDMTAEGGDPVAENRAALIALGAFTGHYRLARLVNVPTVPPLPSAPSQLAGRVDLARHMAVSAALAAITGLDATLTAGSVKELYDSGAGGSGFSLADMRANQAGLMLARAAIRDEDAARRAQMILSSATEAALFGAAADDPEGMSDAMFEARFGSIDDPAYRRALEDQRAALATMPVFQALAGGTNSPAR